MKSSTGRKALSKEARDELLGILKQRFEKNMPRHEGVRWAEVEERLLAHPAKVRTLAEMERTGGEPDVVDYDGKSGEVVFSDCSAETPEGRRNVCYDRAALDARKEFKPGGAALEMAEEIGIQLLTEEQYRHLQTLGAFDTKTSSWLLTPPAIRKLGGALFGDRRYDHVFIYCNGVQSYYRARGFRGVLRV